VADPSKVVHVTNSRFNEREPALSPDGRWVAYQSDETGRAEVFVSDFPKAVRKWQASRSGGQLPTCGVTGASCSSRTPRGRSRSASPRAATRSSWARRNACRSPGRRSASSRRRAAGASVRRFVPRTASGPPRAVRLRGHHRARPPRPPVATPRRGVGGLPCIASRRSSCRSWSQSGDPSPRPALAHDPRTTARKLSQGLDVEGVGRLTSSTAGSTSTRRCSRGPARTRLHEPPQRAGLGPHGPGDARFRDHLPRPEARPGRVRLRHQHDARRGVLGGPVAGRNDDGAPARRRARPAAGPLPHDRAPGDGDARHLPARGSLRPVPRHGGAEGAGAHRRHAHDALAPDRFAIPASDDGLPGAGPIRRYDWFQQLWRERRSDWARTVSQDQRAVVFLGDSITQGWGGGLGAAFPGTKVANRGISGDTTRGVLLRLEETCSRFTRRRSCCSSARTTSRKGRHPRWSQAT